MDPFSEAKKIRGNTTQESMTSRRVFDLICQKGGVSCIQNHRNRRRRNDTLLYRRRQIPQSEG